MIVGGVRGLGGNAEWDRVFEVFVHNMISPDGRSTFETSEALAERIIKVAAPDRGDTVIDMGSGWGNLSLRVAPLVKSVIAIEPSAENTGMAKQRAAEGGIENIRFIAGTFEDPKYAQKADMVLSSLVFHQVALKKAGIRETCKLLRPNGTFVMCDTMMFFDPLSEPEKFNDVYRYLLPRTMPKDAFEKHVRPAFDNNPGYVYTWDDMKAYTPKRDRLYSLREFSVLMEGVGLEIEYKEEIAPFFGIIRARKAIL